MEKRRNCSSGAISPLFHNIFNISLTLRVQLHIYLLNVVVQIMFFSILQIWYVEVRIARSISESALEFEITRVDCIWNKGVAKHQNSNQNVPGLSPSMAIYVLNPVTYTYIKSVHHDTQWHADPVKTQISLHCCAVQSFLSLLSVWKKNVRLPAIHRAPSENSDLSLKNAQYKCHKVFFLTIKPIYAFW